MIFFSKPWKGSVNHTIPLWMWNQFAWILFVFQCQLKSRNHFRLYRDCILISGTFFCFLLFSQMTYSTDARSLSPCFSCLLDTHHWILQVLRWGCYVFHWTSKGREEEWVEAKKKKSQKKTKTKDNWRKQWGTNTYAAEEDGGKMWLCLIMREV